MFREEIAEHGERVGALLTDFPQIASIEASTKSSLIEPLLRCLGYDTSHPQQVSLEVLTELGGRIDYLLTAQTNVKIAVEAKKAGTTLSVKETNQLRSYFTFSDAVAGILTNGVDVWLFTDLDKPNVMDAEPYLMVDIRSASQNDLHHLETLTRVRVSQSAIHEQAQRERYRALINRIVTQELSTPSQEFVRLVGKKAGIKPLTKATMESLKPLVSEAISKNRSMTSPPQSKLSPDSSPGNRLPNEQSPPTKPTPPSAATPPKLGAFTGATLFGKVIPANSYRQMLLAVVAELQTRHPDGFPERVRDEQDFRGKQWWFISKELSDLSPRLQKAKVGEYYVNVNFSRRGSVKQAHRFLRAFGYDARVLEIRTSDD